MSEVDDILHSLKNCVYLKAYTDYQHLLAKLNQPCSGRTASKGSLKNENSFTEEEKAKVLFDLALHKKKIDLMKERIPQIQRALQHQDSENWILGHDQDGVKTHYCKNSADNSIKLKMEGTLNNLPLYEQFVVLHEIDLYHTWAPLCLESKLIEKPCVGEFVGYVNMGMSVVARDMLLRAYGVDCLASHGKFLIIGGSEMNYSGEKPVPFKPVTWLQNRMECKEFRFVVDVLSPTQAKVSIMTHINPNTTLPTRLLNYIMKNLAGIIISVYHKQVVTVATHYHCKHAERVRANPAFYTGWLLSGVRQFCESKGWYLPPVTCLGALDTTAASSCHDLPSPHSSKSAGLPDAAMSPCSATTDEADDCEYGEDDDFSTQPWFGV